MKQKIQLVLFLAMLVAVIRLAIIFYERHEQAAQAKKQQGVALDPDYYVSPRKLYPYDLKSAQQLTNQPVWVKVGYYYPYYPYDPTTHAVNFANEAGRLRPIQKLEIRNVVPVPSKDAPGQKQLMAVFAQSGGFYAVAIGSETSGDFKFLSDDMFFIQDPHQLYRHWAPDVWQAIDRNEVKPGMNELQTDFALGVALAEPGGDAIDKTLNYPNGGKPLSITYHDGKVVMIRSGPG